jgi:hypothetical protein
MSWLGSDTDKSKLDQATRAAQQRSLLLVVQLERTFPQVPHGQGHHLLSTSTVLIASLFRGAVLLGNFVLHFHSRCFPFFLKWFCLRTLVSFL